MRQKKITARHYAKMYGLKIVRCPICGRLAALWESKAFKDISYVHEATLTSLPGLGAFVKAIQVCRVGKPQIKNAN